MVAHDGTDWNIVNHVTIDSFGRRTAESDDTIEVFHGLGGRPYDEETGLQNHLHRWYSVDTGRWMSEDPIGFAGGHANLNVYVSNSPVNGVDPRGLLPPGWDANQIAAWRHRKLVEAATLQAYADIDKMVNGTIRGHGNDWFDKLSDFAAGWGDVLSFNLTNWVREHAGWNNAVDFDSSSYSAGEWTGAIHLGAIFGAASGSVRSEVTSAVVEQATGIPMIVNPLDLVQSGGKSIDDVVRVASSGQGILPAQTVREIAHGEKVQDLIQEIAERTYTSGGLEHAIISLNTGPRVIVVGGRGGITLPDDVRHVFIHTHPSPTGPSDLDFEMLERLGQQHSYIYELFGGGLTRF
jgi:RHS repeat-associated protein